jgi:hypothetical protein
MCRKLVFLISIGVVLTIAGNVSAELVGHWKLDEGSGTKAADSSGNGNDGTFFNNPTWIAGVNGAALEFHGLGAAGGGGDYINCGNKAIMDIGGPISIALWIRPGADDPEGKATTTAPMAKALSTLSPSWSYQVRYGWGGAPQPYMAFTFNTTPRAWAFVGKKLTRDEWCHIACSYDGTTLKCYLNGLQTDSTPMGPITKSSTPVLIGTDGWGCDWIGAIDDVRLYNHALSEVEILGTMEGKTWPYAYGPEPEDGALYPNTWAELKWKPSPTAVTHDVYLGEKFDDVNSGAAGTFRGNQATTSLLVGLGMPGDPYPGGLVPGTTYYWRIDEVNTADPNSPWKGPVWSFSIPPRTAYNPIPVDGAESVALNTKLTWTAGFGAKLHTVYLGGDFDAVSSATSGGTMSGTTTYSPTSLKAGQVYYWRVDEVNPPNTYKGPTWSFTTPGAVGKPHPANGAPDAEMNAILSWTRSASAASHRVYFGTDKEAVRKAGTTSPEYKGVKALGAESYDPGLLPWDSSYYWRIDEVNNTNAASPWKGPLWTFTTGKYLLVEDFESYNDIDPPGAGSNRIFDKWIDGFGTTTNGAVVGNNLPPYAEQTVVHGGKQSMPYAYDTNLKFSEATLVLASTRNWTAQGVTSLSLWFRGASTNAAERMYVALNGTAVVYQDNPDATKIAGWTKWVIPLQAFADQGVNLANVTSISIGFGTKGNTTAAGGTGKMYFDDLRLLR